MGFGITGFKKIIKSRDFGVNGQFWTSDGRGSPSWQSGGTGTGSFFFVDEFEIYDTTNLWNEEISAPATIATDGDILTLDSGATGFAQNYSVAQTLTPRQAGSITFECRLRRNTNSGADDKFFLGLGDTFQSGDVPNWFAAFTSTSDDNDEMKGQTFNGSSFDDTTTFAVTNNTYVTFKIIITDGAPPTAKYYLNDTLKKTQNLATLYRDITFFAFFWVNDQNPNNVTLEINYVKLKNG